MLYGRSIKFYKRIKPHYYGSKEEGKESSKEDCSKEEEEGVSHILPQRERPASAGLSLCRRENSLYCSTFLQQPFSPYREYGSKDLLQSKSSHYFEFSRLRNLYTFIRNGRKRMFDSGDGLRYSR